MGRPQSRQQNGAMASAALAKETTKSEVLRRVPLQARHEAVAADHAYKFLICSHASTLSHRARSIHGSARPDSANIASKKRTREALV